MRRVVSISLGSSKRNKTHEVEILGQSFRIERIGTDGDLKKFADLFTELDGKVDALGVGGADLYLVFGGRRYPFKQIHRLIAGAKTTPVVDGSGLKQTLERETIQTLQREGIVDFPHERVLLVSMVDRFGMAEALLEVGAKTTYGDLLFGVGLPIPIRSYAFARLLAKAILPIITRLPLKWFYPTGSKQDSRSPKFPKVFAEATLICGDWHYIKRYASDKLPDKTILTQTLRKADLDWLKSTGARRAITTTPEMGGETFATNVMEGVLVALNQKRPEELTPADYLRTLAELNWKPNVIDLQ